MTDQAMIAHVEFYNLSSGVLAETKLKKPRSEREVRAVADQINAGNKEGKKGSVDVVGRQFMLVHDSNVPIRFVDILNAKD